ncbi:MAG: hypothetical protein ACLFPN_02865 [Methanomassiliicoccales archaeon]
MMDIEILEDEIRVDNKTITELDSFVLDFTMILSKYVEYVIVSGYVAIFFGRSRGTEDIDVISKKMDKRTFLELHDDLAGRGYEFLNPEDASGLYEMLEEGLAIRISKTRRVIPNIELKFTKDDFDTYSLSHRLKVTLNKEILYLNPIEMQIPYKLWLSSEKDIEDALYLWDIFKERIDKGSMKMLMAELEVEGGGYGIEI